MSIPVVLLRQCLVDAVIEVFVVGKDNMSANVIKLVDQLVFGTAGLKGGE